MRKKIEDYSAIAFSFIIGALFAAFLCVRYHTIPTLERISIRGSAMEAYKAVSTLELIRDNKVDIAVDFLEWQADDGLIGLSRYTRSPESYKRLDGFARNALLKSREYRSKYPRETKSKSTDKIVQETLLAGFSNDSDN